MPAQREQNSREELDERIAKAERPSAAPRPAAQNQPAEHGNIVVPGNQLAATAVRTRAHDRFALGDPVDADIQKTSDARSNHAEEDGEKPRKLERDLLEGIHVSVRPARRGPRSSSRLPEFFL
jgi:hypothetical protein